MGPYGCWNAKKSLYKPLRAYVQRQKLVVEMCYSDRYVCFDGELVKDHFDFVNLN